MAIFNSYVSLPEINPVGFDVYIMAGSGVLMMAFDFNRYLWDIVHHREL